MLQTGVALRFTVPRVAMIKRLIVSAFPCEALLSHLTFLYARTRWFIGAGLSRVQV
jgi:hypothetical protein